MAEYRLQQSVNYLLANLSLHCLLLYPCIVCCTYFPKITIEGVNIMKRKLGAHDNLKMTIQQDGNKFIIKESSNFRTLDTEFTLGVNFDYTLADGTEVSGAWNMEGNKLVGSFTRKDNGKVLKVCREIVDDELVQTSVYEGVEAKRIFKRG